MSGDTTSIKQGGQAYTISRRVTIELWDQHLTGKQGIGVIPINEDSFCKFGAIDIDRYDIDLVKLSIMVHQKNLPLVVIRSKSGGAHLYLFSRDWIPAKIIHDKLRELAALIGYGGSEIFPKQIQIVKERGDRGQWINMPYFGGHNTNRYAYKDGKVLSLESFVKYVGEVCQTSVSIPKITGAAPEILHGGPPCLQHLISSGFPPGTRNNGLFNLGIYARKLSPDNWGRLIEEYNIKYMDPPLSAIEVLGVVKSLNKGKEYNYKCNEQPIQQYCDAARCRMCKYGVGTANFGMPKFGTLTKLASDPPIWFIDVEGGARIELVTEDLQNPVKFQKKCMDALTIMPTLIKRDEWQMMVQKLLEEVTIVEVPRESTPKGQLMNLLYDFCTSRVSAKVRDEIMLGKPLTENGFHMFRLSDFIKFLERQKFDMQINHIHKHLRDEGALARSISIRGKAIPIYTMRQFTELPADIPAPDIPSPEVL